VRSVGTDGRPALPAGGVAVDQNRKAALATSSTGLIAYRTGSGAVPRQFVWFDRSGKQLRRVGDPDLAYPRVVGERCRAPGGEGVRHAGTLSVSEPRVSLAPVPAHSPVRSRVVGSFLSRHPIGAASRRREDVGDGPGGLLAPLCGL
jgi:hypothetical protein